MPTRSPIRWSVQKLAILSRLQQTGSAHHPYGRKAATAQLQAVEGDFDAASATIRATLAEAGDFLALPDAAQTDFLITLFVVQETEILADLLCRIDDPGHPVRIVISPSGPGPGPARVRWDIIPGEAASFTFDAANFLDDEKDARIMLFVWAFPLYAAYLRQCGCDRAGSTILNLYDFGMSPGLAPSDYRLDYFLIPDHMFVSSRGYAGTRAHYLANDVPWEERIPAALWRGTTTGRIPGSGLPWQTLPRIRLCELGRSEEARGLIDAGIVGVVQADTPEDAVAIQNSGLMRPFIPPTEFNHYRYHIDIDGNSNSWPGLFQKLMTGSPVLKVASPLGYRQWYYDDLKPWVNYVPVASDLSDLVERIDWLRANEERAVAIGQAGRKLALSLDYAREIEKSFKTIRAALDTGLNIAG